MQFVPKGYTQQEGVGYMEAFSPVAKMSTIRVVLALVVVNNWYLHQMDVNNALLYGDLSEKIYIRAPEGYNVSSGKVLRLEKSIYGLKQVSKQ